jgi:hypothetical protein
MRALVAVGSDPPPGKRRRAQLAHVVLCVRGVEVRDEFLNEYRR